MNPGILAGRCKMGPKSTPSLVDILRKTLQDLEENNHVKDDDPAILRLKRSLARMIAELEVIKTERIAS